jgi:hypothetical protein
MRIETASGHTILADDADEPLLRGYSWWASKTSDGNLYACARVLGSGYPGKRIKMHRLIMAPPPHLVVHHKNNNGLDNRRSNLEVTTTRKNIIYAHEGKEIGAYLRESGKWHAKMRGLDGKVVYLGAYTTRDAALAAVASFKAETRS